VKKSELEYHLPPERIAQVPAARRDESRLLVLDRATGRRRHETFNRLPELLPPGALLVMNDTRVLPARLQLRRATGGRVDGLFLREPVPGQWEVMVTDAQRLKPGEVLSIESSDRTLRLLERVEAGVWRTEPQPLGDSAAILAECGLPPLPPYIRRQYGPGPHRRDAGATPEGGHPARPASGQDARPPEVFPPDAAAAPGPDPQLDVERYQTIYAARPGAIAAPTAGLHFTPLLLETLRAQGFETAFVTLHVGVGTFAPIRCEDLAEHEMHAEWYDCPPETAAAVNAARAAGRPIVAVGTTSVRVLESVARCPPATANPPSAPPRWPPAVLSQPEAAGPLKETVGPLAPGTGWTRLFIYPPCRFRAVDALLTNFHLPGSTLLAMVFAFAGRARVLAAYEEAIRREYRFYSYGDAMLLL
jgi:S-adenosylmethionine:tRNA ribosyltransferase-isomerase